MPISVSTGDPNARAVNAAQLRYGGQEDAVQRAIQALAVSRAADEAAINQYGTGGRTAINETFNQLASNLGTNRELNAANLGIQAEQIGQGYRDANQIAEAARAQGVQNLRQLFGGNVAYQSGSLAAAADPIEALAARIVGQNAQQDATVTGNLRNWAAQQDSILGAGISGAERDRANRLSGFESELLRALATARNEATNDEYNLQSQLLDLLNERGAFTADAAANFADTAFGQQLQAAQYNLSEQDMLRQAAAQAAQIAMQREASSRAAAEDDWKRALAERSQSFDERKYLDSLGQVDNEDYWRQLDYELRAQQAGLGSRSFLAEQEQQDLENKMALAQTLFENGVIGGKDQPSFQDFLISQGVLQGSPGPITASAVANVPTSIKIGKPSLGGFKKTAMMG